MSEIIDTEGVPTEPVVKPCVICGHAKADHKHGEKKSACECGCMRWRAKLTAADLKRLNMLDKKQKARGDKKKKKRPKGKLHRPKKHWYEL